MRYLASRGWTEAAAECGLDIGAYTVRARAEEELMPWDHICMGVTKRHLIRERRRAYEGVLSPDCAHGCVNCGAKALNGGVCNG